MSSTSPFSYTWTPTTLPSATARPGRRITTSRTELLQIGIAYAVLTFCLVILLSGSDALFGTGNGLLFVSPILVAVAAAAALTGFVMHELAHKVAAQHRGFWAEFRLSPMGLVLALFTAFVGLLFAAPGATVVGGMSPADRRNWGQTSLAGPLTNFAFGLAFYGAALGASVLGSSVFGWLLLLAYINGWFGTFNLIPLGPLDGAKVFRWSKGIWATAIAVMGAFAVVSYLAFFVYGRPTLLWPL
jgi:Zn-dependent protease